MTATAFHIGYPYRVNRGLLFRFCIWLNRMMGRQSPIMFGPMPPPSLGGDVATADEMDGAVSKDGDSIESLTAERDELRKNVSLLKATNGELARSLNERGEAVMATVDDACKHACKVLLWIMGVIASAMALSLYLFFD